MSAGEEDRFAVRSSWAGHIVAQLDQPTSRWGTLSVGALVGLIYGSIVLLVIEARYPIWADTHAVELGAANIAVLGIFLAELALRVAGYRRPDRYLTSSTGAVDIIVVLSGFASLLLPAAPAMAWLRALRLLRMARLLKFAALVRRLGSGGFGAVAAALAPFAAIAIGFKGILVAAEAQPWWPGFGDLSIIISVAGFAIGILLGTKLSIAQSRLYDVEDAICRIVGGLRDIRADDPDVAEGRSKFLAAFSEVVANETRGNTDAFSLARKAAERFESALESAGIGGPATANLHRDIEFVLHRVATQTPAAYEQFLRTVTIGYASMVIVAVPGLTGFVSVLMVIYILGGMYVVIDDMDRPLDRGPATLTGIDSRPLNLYLDEISGGWRQSDDRQ